MSATSLLFLSGAGLPEWIWDATRAALSETSVIAPRPARKDADVSGYAEAALEAAPAGPLTLVAHSAGGVIAAEVTTLAPERIHGVLGVTAVIPTAGRSFASSMPFPTRLLLPMILKLAGTRPPESSIRKSLAAGVDQIRVDRLIHDFTPETRAYFTSALSTEIVAPVRGYVTSNDDAELPIALQKRYAAKLQPTFFRSLTGGHLPMLRDPHQLARAIRNFQKVVDEQVHS
ncbi:alpha/beta fold hydrolase [Arthrobacter sp.]|uniref:alpha/beta fold hydrolase n=1 Tax=Arthrobacter sp. TaxID=1667 RepID=UPI0026DED53C|nr:alpha/beta hydrolase [Arthrobacter sp.]MDO5753957.1 alpha/beta hydrolase [Arthrobacter sp.]